MTKISVIVCTHNRLRYLDSAIGSLCRQTLPREHFEIILVDNASPDGTRPWAARQRRDIANLIYLYEPVLGLSNARNAGWRAAKAELVAFLDDDAIADPNWLEAIVRKFEKHDERLAAIGGRVYPLWEAPPPDWLLPGLWGSLSMLDLGEHDLVMGRDHYFVGANMAVRKSALARAGGFNGALGRKGRRLLSNEEIYLKWQLERGGYYALYAPDVIVGHAVPGERMSKKWFRSRYLWQGISDSVMRQAMNESPRADADTLARHVRRTARFALQWISRRIREPGSQSMASQCSEYWTLGFLLEGWRTYFCGPPLPPATH